MNKSEKIKNLFNINNSTENIPLNHSVITDIDAYLKENKEKRNQIREDKLNAINKRRISNLNEITNFNTAINTNTSIDRNNSYNKIIYSELQEENSKPRNKIEKIQPPLIKKNIEINKKTEEHKLGKKIPFFSNVFRDSAKRFVLNRNPGVGLYNIDTDRYGKLNIYFFC
jgi:hypothetical protein